MSSYLLLRNNKESGPFDLEEIKGMSLRPYDLLWVVGKSAAWRYPSEIPELKPFAPAVPEPTNDPFNKNSESAKPAEENATFNKTETGLNKNREKNLRRINPGQSVYVHLPVEKKSTAGPASIILFDDETFPASKPEPAFDYSKLYEKPPGRSVRFSGKLLWVSTIILLFGAGILTGFFISDRRKFFSTDANHPQKGPDLQPAVLNDKKEVSTGITKAKQPGGGDDSDAKKTDSLKTGNSISKKFISGSGKKNSKNVDVKKDSPVNQTDFLSSLKLNDSLKQNAIPKTEMLYQKIKAHPENYINMVTGRYSTGMFGGISSFPVTLTNNSPVMMDLVIVNIDYIQNNQKIFKTESLSVNDLEPGESVTIKAPKSPRGVKIVTRIQVVNSRQLDLSSSN